MKLRSQFFSAGIVCCLSSVIGKFSWKKNKTSAAWYILWHPGPDWVMCPHSIICHRWYNGSRLVKFGMYDQCNGTIHSVQLHGDVMWNKNILCLELYYVHGRQSRGRHRLLTNFRTAHVQAMIMKIFLQVWFLTWDPPQDRMQASQHGTIMFCRWWNKYKDICKTKCVHVLTFSALAQLFQLCADASNVMCYPQIYSFSHLEKINIVI